MIRETYRGCKIRTAMGRRGYSKLTVNGVVLGEYEGTQEQVLATAKARIDAAQDDGVARGRYRVELYAPGTYQLCPEGHVMPIDGECGHPQCATQPYATSRPQPAAAATRTAFVPRFLGHLRRGEAKPSKAGRAARLLFGAFNSVGRRRGAKYYVARRALLRFLLVEQADRHNAALAEAGHITAAQYLREVVGADEKFIRTYASAFGRAAATAYRKIFGAEPATDGLTVIGNRRPRLNPIATYGPHARLALQTATTTHEATAALYPIGA